MIGDIEPKTYVSILDENEYKYISSKIPYDIEFGYTVSASLIKVGNVDRTGYVTYWLRDNHGIVSVTEYSPGGDKKRLQVRIFSSTVCTKRIRKW